MSEPLPIIPAGAFPECATHEQKISVSVLGATKAAFDSRQKSLTAMRTAVNDHETRLDSVEQQLEVLNNRPF